MHGGCDLAFFRKCRKNRLEKVRREESTFKGQRESAPTATIEPPNTPSINQGCLDFLCHRVGCSVCSRGLNWSRFSEFSKSWACWPGFRGWRQ
jgi:hypothetical protein